MNRSVLAEPLVQFGCLLPQLCATLSGPALVDAVHRQYEHVICATPKPLLDDAHDAMSHLMKRHGIDELQRVVAAMKVA